MSSRGPRPPFFTLMRQAADLSRSDARRAAPKRRGRHAIPAPRQRGEIRRPANAAGGVNARAGPAHHRDRRSRSGPASPPTRSSVMTMTREGHSRCAASSAGIPRKSSPRKSSDRISSLSARELRKPRRALQRFAAKDEQSSAGDATATIAPWPRRRRPHRPRTPPAERLRQGRATSSHDRRADQNASRSAT